MSRQSASPWQPKADQGMHRGSSSSLHRYRRGWREPDRRLEDVGCCSRFRASFSRHRRTSIRRYGGSKASTLISRRPRSSCSLITFGGDSACTDRNRVLRVPGFRNCKYDPAHPVTVEYLSDDQLSSRRLPAGRSRSSIRHIQTHESKQSHPSGKNKPF